MEAGTVPAAAPRGALRGASPSLLRLASDNHLVRLVRAGRHSAFEVVYDRYHRSILAFCTHLLGDRHEAEDAVQHTFMAAYNSLVEHDRPIQLRPWLFAIARNRCFTVLRARREVAVPEMLDAESENPASVVQRREDLRDLVFDVRSLPEDQRAALVMAELGALSHEEIALALDVPREKVKALVFQARESLVATRIARETDCADIRQELSSLRGPALRRSHLRRHLHACEGCREYRSQLRHQRARLAVLLPVLPSAALREAVLKATVGARNAGAGAGGGAAAAAGSSAVKLALIKPVAMVVLSAAGAVMVAHAVTHHHRPAVVEASRTPAVAHGHRASRHAVRVHIHHVSFTHRSVERVRFERVRRVGHRGLAWRRSVAERRRHHERRRVTVHRRHERHERRTVTSSSPVQAPAPSESVSVQVPVVATPQPRASSDQPTAPTATSDAAPKHREHHRRHR